MSKVKVVAKQSLFDIAIENQGSVLQAFRWAQQNGLSVTDELTPGQELEFPDITDNSNTDITSYFSGSSKKIATATTYTSEDNTSPILEGIGYMAIEVDFEVQ